MFLANENPSSLPAKVPGRHQGTRASTDSPPMSVMFMKFTSGNFDPAVNSVSQYAESPSEKAALITFSDRVCQAAHDVPYVASLLEKVLYLTQ